MREREKGREGGRKEREDMKYAHINCTCVLHKLIDEGIEKKRKRESEGERGRKKERQEEAELDRREERDRQIKRASLAS